MTTTKLKPDWAGDDLLSRLVNRAIQTPALYSLMKRQARQVLIKTAEKNGVPWRQTCLDLDTPEMRQRLTELTNPAVVYPDYYQVPFHAYSEGNLCWQAAFEAAPATYAMALRVWPQEEISWQEAQVRLRQSFLEVLDQHGPAEVTDILDVGCSVGISTLSLHRHYAQRNPVRTVGLDLSPYMLAVAQFQDANREIAQWVHGAAEATGFPDASFDVVTMQFVAHELPRTATQAIFAEARRVLRPGGVLAIVDNNPKSSVIQALPPVLFTLMKSTEPWSDDYYTFDLEVALVEAGFEPPVVVPSDPRHRTLVARQGG
ncbi:MULTISPECIES: class I SAM-dependent methyltransferase [Cyanophyceae]|uniref:class I SAM-dependent methyltransferase n=1 Tax=Cyanophyceae TaxID=3028117 RepID=UPI001687A398|nr:MULTISPECIES: class I SAM-dependent methyltransferase [Cyanophyceae]MBD1916207.1 class I SAM-dependent methyltransferase [Phormidium sp. FACHB-77]MBD2031524.1 class I SAM-dependent methyltransferase [Phormidium sp. FACHB-322]MBD2052849.1 class I SAM-dependent methyltransferase [Leptolyngbya sp. FACHB-60]